MNDSSGIESIGNGSFADATLDSLVEHLSQIVGGKIQSVQFFRQELEITVNSSDLLNVLMTLRDDKQLAFTQLIDMTAIDYPERRNRFDVIYLLLSISNNARLRLVAQIGEGQTVPSATSVFMGANWPEREIWDMFGIFFADHPDLRRLLTDYGFEGHPLRKDFPLSGHVEARYDDTQRRVINKEVHLVQEFRDFDFLSPWEGLQKNIVFDQKSQTQKK